MSQNIIPKDCSYGCNTRIYWSVADNAYFEVFTKQKHICKNRSINTASGNLPGANTSNTNRPYYSKKPWIPKPKMDNSLEVIQGTISEVTSKYEILTDLIRDYNGKTHGSQSHIVANNNIQLIVYFEVTLGQRDEVKRKFDNMIRNLMVLQRN